MGVFCRIFSLDIFKPQSLTETEYNLVYFVLLTYFTWNLIIFQTATLRKRKFGPIFEIVRNKIRGIRVEMTQQLTDLVCLYVVIVDSFLISVYL